MRSRDGARTGAHWLTKKRPDLIGLRFLVGGTHTHTNTKLPCYLSSQLPLNYKLCQKDHLITFILRAKADKEFKWRSHKATAEIVVPYRHRYIS